MSTRETLENLTVAWQDAGLSPAAVEPIERALARHNELDRERAVLGGATAVLAAIAGRVATGEVAFAQAVVELHDAEAANDRGQGGILKAPSRADRLYDAARGAIIRLAVERLNDRAGELVGIVEAEADGVQAELEKLAGILAGIPDAARELVADLTEAEQDAVYTWDLLERAVDAAGKKQATAFDELKELDRRRAALLRVASALEEAGISRPSGLADRGTFELAGLLPLPVRVAA